jgi:hypothetical protein
MHGDKNKKKGKKDIILQIQFTWNLHFSPVGRFPQAARKRKRIQVRIF